MIRAAYLGQSQPDRPVYYSTARIIVHMIRASAVTRVEEGVVYVPPAGWVRVVAVFRDAHTRSSHTHMHACT